jgi:hypothetical protein
LLKYLQHVRRPEFKDFRVSRAAVRRACRHPGIVVDNDPALEFSGVDEQLNKAIEVIKEEMKSHPAVLPPPPPYPDKSR